MKVRCERFKVTGAGKCLWGNAALVEAMCKAVAIQGLFCCLWSFFTGEDTILEFHLCSKHTFFFRYRKDV